MGNISKIREIYMLYYERKITNFIMLLNIVRSSVLKRHSYLYMTRESEQRFDVSEKITVFSFFIREIYKVYYEEKKVQIVDTVRIQRL